MPKFHGMVVFIVVLSLGCFHDNCHGDIFMGIPCINFHGITMGSITMDNFHGIIMGNFHGITMVVSWYYYGCFMVLPWGVLLFVPMVFFFMALPRDNFSMIFMVLLWVVS